MESLKKEIYSVNSEVTPLKAAKTELEESLKKNSDELSEVKKEAELLKKENTSLQTEVSTLKSDLASVSAVTNSQKGSVEEVSTLKAAVFDLSNRVIGLQGEKENSLAELHNSELRVEELGRKTLHLSEQLFEVQKENSDAESRFVAKIEELENKNHSLELVVEKVKVRLLFSEIFI